MRLALFDLDNTLIAGDSDFEWAQFLIEQGVLDREVYEARNMEFYQQYKDGTLDIHEFLDFQLKPLSRHTRAQLDAWHQEFMQHKIRPIVLPRARALVDRHRDRGDLCAIVTATNRFVTEPIARIFGVENLIATEPEVMDGEFTGKVRGVPSFREGKVTRLEAWLGNRRLRWSDVQKRADRSGLPNNRLALLKQLPDRRRRQPLLGLAHHQQRGPWRSQVQVIRKQHC